MIEQAYRRFIIPGFESVLKRRKTFRFWNELEDSQWWSRERLEELQLRRLHELITYCFSYSPYYRDLWTSQGLSLRDLRSLSDIQKWPVTSREAMRDHADEIASTAQGVKVVSKSTGGSSGVPLRFVIEREADDRRMAAAHRGYAWAGAAPGTRQTHLWGVALGNTSRLHRWKEYLHARYLYRREMLNSFDLSDESIPKFLGRIHRFGPDVLVAYTNPLYLFARTIEQRGLRAYRPKALIVGAEKLHDFQRELIERVFSAPVFETYGAREFTLIGAECEHHTGLHLTMENLLVEVVDDDGVPTPAGEEGNVVITDLFNVAMPFIRYQIGDRAISGFGSCACGRGLPLLKKVVGRQLDMLITADGRHLAGEFFPHLIKDYPAVRQFQVVQSQRDLIELKLVVNGQWGQETRESLRKKVQASVGGSTRLRIHEVDNIPLTAMGKLRVVIRHPSAA
jgi:phenylacetate-CoA ligase